MDSTHIINIVLAIGLIAAIAFCVYSFIQYRKTVLKLKALIRKKEELIKKEVPAIAILQPQTRKMKGMPVVSSSQLFSQFTALIHDEKLYRNMTLDRETICRRLGIERHALNHLLNEHAGGQSVPAYINNVRMDVAHEMLRNDPGCSIADIAAAVGFTPQNLRIQFKRRYGITPMEYRSNRQNESETPV